MSEHQVFAVTPRLNGGGSILHLYIPGYRPGAKRRSPSEAAMCNAPTWTTTSFGPDQGREIRRHVPLAEALTWIGAAPESPVDPRPTFRWCAVCVGRLLELRGELANTLTRLSDGDPD